jgi:hypothetical protein
VVYFKFMLDFGIVPTVWYLLFDFRIVPTVWYILFDFRIVPTMWYILFRQCGIFCSDNMVYFVSTV